jgi:phosphoglycolate phosphatase-like HAD superfamily hydrolase
MHQISDYDIYIFDCDGVILDSNQLKIDSMESALCSLFNQKTEVANCVDYFKHNFGKSRFHHIDVFLDDYLSIDEKEKGQYRQKILTSYSSMCKTLYLEAVITPDFLTFIRSLDGKKFIASGSEQEELRYVFKKRGLDALFDGIYGSPIAKSENIKTILKNENNTNAIMFGDAISDLNAAVDNKIDFVAYTPFSNVAVQLEEQSIKQGYRVIGAWKELTNHVSNS